MSKALTKSFQKLWKSSILSRNASVYKAAAIKKIGKPLEIIEKKTPSLKPNQVRIQVKYCSVNSVDCEKFRQEGTELPFIPGYEFSGEVIEKGKEVSNERVIVGDRAVGLSLEQFGGIAEQCVLEADDVWRIPSDVEIKDAAVIAYGHSTALYAFSKLSNIKENERILISAGPAGLGLAAVDVAANIYAAKVIGLADTEERGELLRERGAFETLHFDKKLVKRCLDITDNKGVKIVYDAVGEHMMETIGNCVANEGKIFYAAPFFYKTLPAPKPHSFATIVSLKELRRQNLHLYRTIVDDTLEMANEGVIGAHISAEFKLEKINDAIEFINEKKCNGKVLIRIDS